MRVEAYYNLHRRCLSYRPVGRGGRVAHADVVVLDDVVFAVQPAGRARVLREMRKNVHAFVRGTLVGHEPLPSKRGWVRVVYDPYRHATFVEADTGLPVLRARRVVIEDRQVWALR